MFDSLRNILDAFENSLSLPEKNLYKPKLNFFMKYLETNYDFNLENYKSIEKIFSEVTKDDIRKGLEHYKSESLNVNYKKTAKDFVTAVNELFRFLHEKSIINEDIIKGLGVSKTDPSTITILFKEIDNDFTLLDEEKYPPITENEYEEIKTRCNNIIDTLINSGKESKNYTNFTSAIIAKLLLFTGIQYSFIPHILIEDFNQNHNTIHLNGYVVHLPNRLSDHLRHYLDIRNKRLEAKGINNYQYLFVTFHGQQLPENSGTYLGEFINSCRTGEVSEEEIEIAERNHYTPTGLSKFAIMKMIEEGINQYIIQDFTGVDDTIYKDCQTRVNNNKQKDPQKASRYIDSKLRALATFDEL